MLTLPCQPLSLIGYPRQPELYIYIYFVYLYTNCIQFIYNCIFIYTECFALPLIKCATGVTSKAFITGPSYNSFITFQWFIWKLVMAFPGRQEFGGMSPCTQTHTKKRRMLGWSMQPTQSLGSLGPRSRHWHSAGLIKPRSPNIRAWLLIRRDFYSMAVPGLAPGLSLELTHWLALSLLSKDSAPVTV